MLLLTCLLVCLPFPFFVETWSHNAALDGFELEAVILPLSPQCCEHKECPTPLTFTYLFCELKAKIVFITYKNISLKNAHIVK